MSALRTFFRHCPACGRRFEIRLVEKEKVDSEEHEATRKTAPSPFISSALASMPSPTMLVPLEVSEEAPTVVDVEEFQYTYRCKHCGHEWSEVHDTREDIDEPAGYTGD